MAEPETPAVRRVVLLGLMGAGKSTVGRLLAGRLGWRFVDLDERIEQRAGRRVADIFRAEGEASFRAWEAACTRELAGVDRLVLAPGGGWVVDPGNPARLGDGTLAVWLQVPVDVALARLSGQRANRPLLHAPDPRAAIARLLREREDRYSRADLHVSTADRTPGEVARQIEHYLRVRRGARGGVATQE